MSWGLVGVAADTELAPSPGAPANVFDPEDARTDLPYLRCRRGSGISADLRSTAFIRADLARILVAEFPVLLQTSIDGLGEFKRNVGIESRWSGLDLLDDGDQKLAGGFPAEGEQPVHIS